MKLILLGPPGVGKGTQAQLLSNEYNIPQISTGDILRGAIQRSSELGRKANDFMSKGELVPDDIILGLIQDKLFGEKPPNGYILDGFPRTIVQAKALKTMFEEHHDALDAVLSLEADEKLIVKRLSSRRTCRNCKTVYNLITKPPVVDGVCDTCSGELYQRDDDKIDTIQNRIAVYKKQTEPLIDFYRAAGILFAINSSGSPEEVHNIITSQLED
ncbi:MAG: adenylate kinase [Candidatus Marinimicrobia bacterium]|nr:adenylate kinase [Candidatus Neomarinimicrobiota bacterium]